MVFVPKFKTLHDPTVGKFQGDIIRARYLQNGLAADRPVAGERPGHCYYATDTGTLSIWDGTTWDDFVVSGHSHAHSGLTEIGDTTHPQIDAAAHSYNGSFVEPMTFVVAESGGSIIGTLDKNPSGDLTQRFSDGYSTITSGGLITLTAAGADTTPVKNFIYILQSNKTTIVAGASWPATEHIKIAEVIVQTAATLATDGPLANRNWNDFRKGPTGQGHHTHAWERVRWEHSAYFSGSAVTWTGSGTSTLDLAITAGKAYQLHLQSIDAFDTTDPGEVLVPNHNATAYLATADIETLVADSIGGSLSNKYYNLVIWGSISSASETERVFINLPGGSYTKQEDATSDTGGFDNYAIPSDFRGYAYLIQRVTIKHAPGGPTWTIIQENDLRGQVPNIVAGSGTAAITTQFADSQFRVFDDGDPSKEIALQASSISASTTRTVTVPDKDLTLIDSADAVAAIEAETTLEFDAATVISTAAGALTLSSANGLTLGTPDDHTSQQGSLSFATDIQTIDANGDIGTPVDVRFKITSNSGADDDLNEIGAGAVNGQFIIIHPVADDNITLKHATAGGGSGKQLRINGEADLVLSENWHMAFGVYNTTDSLWYIFAPGSGGSGDVATDTIWDAKGDLAGGTGADTAERLAVGTDDQVLTADSGETTGMKWANAAGGSAPNKQYAFNIPGEIVSALDDAGIIFHVGADDETVERWTINVKDPAAGGGAGLTVTLAYANGNAAEYDDSPSWQDIDTLALSTDQSNTATSGFTDSSLTSRSMIRIDIDATAGATNKASDLSVTLETSIT